MSKSDQSWLRWAMKEFGVKRLRVKSSPSTAAWPDLWIEKTHPPVLTVTKEWARQPVQERQKRLVHELLHLKGLEHGKIGSLNFNTRPELDSYSCAVYQSIVGGRK